MNFHHRFVLSNKIFIFEWFRIFSILLTFFLIVSCHFGKIPVFITLAHFPSFSFIWEAFRKCAQEHSGEDVAFGWVDEAVVVDVVEFPGGLKVSSQKLLSFIITAFLESFDNFSSSLVGPFFWEDQLVFLTLILLMCVVSLKKILQKFLILGSIACDVKFGYSGVIGVIKSR